MEEEPFSITNNSVFSFRYSKESPNVFDGIKLVNKKYLCHSKLLFQINQGN